MLCENIEESGAQTFRDDRDIGGADNGMPDADLAALYGVETKRRVEAVKRNIERFPADFIIQLRKEEFGILRSQLAASSERRISTRSTAGGSIAA